jgi:hypothetical protein
MFLYIGEVDYFHKFKKKEILMNTTTRTVFIVLVVLVIGSGLFFAGQVYGGWRSASFYGDGWMPMMGGRGGWNPGPAYGLMMNGRGNGYGPMMGGGYDSNYAKVQPLTIDEAKQAAQAYLDSLNVSGLKMDEVMVFDNNAYVVVEEEATGVGAFELLVDPISKIAYPEHGPNMMWNLKYGGLNHQNMMGGRGGFMMGGMMGQNFLSGDVTNVSADMPVTEEQAAQAAQAYLDQYFPSAEIEGDAVAFYGYYTFDFSRDGKVAGMLSVNGYSGQAFYHTWHGTFIEEAEME